MARVRKRHALIFAAVLGLFCIRLQANTGGRHLSLDEQDVARSAILQLTKQPRGPLFVGAASAILPDPLGTRTLPPYAEPRANVLLTGQGGQVRSAIVTLDTLLIPDRSQQVIRAAVGAVAELPVDRIMVVASHSHAGPRLPGGLLFRMGFGDAEIKHSQLLALMDEISRKALRNFSEAAMRVGVTELDRWVGVRSKGALGGLDKQLRVALFKSKRQRIVLWSYAAHPTLVDRNSPVADGDYPARVANLMRLEEDAEEVIFLPGLTAQATPATVRKVDEYAALIAAAVAGLTAESEARLAEVESGQRKAFPAGPVEAMETEIATSPALPIWRPLVLAPWLTARLGSSDQRVKLHQIQGLRLIGIPGEAAYSRLGGGANNRWFVSMAGTGMGYLVPASDMHREPERIMVLLGGTDSQRVAEFLQILRDHPN